MLVACLTRATQASLRKAKRQKRASHLTPRELRNVASWANTADINCGKTVLPYLLTVPVTQDQQVCLFLDCPRPDFGSCAELDANDAPQAQAQRASDLGPPDASVRARSAPPLAAPAPQKCLPMHGPHANACTGTPHYSYIFRSWFSLMSVDGERLDGAREQACRAVLREAAQHLGALGAFGLEHLLEDATLVLRVGAEVRRDRLDEEPVWRRRGASCILAAGWPVGLTHSGGVRAWYRDGRVRGGGAAYNRPCVAAHT